MSASVFTEEGRTRLKNFRNRCFGYTLGGLGLGIFAGLCIYGFYIKGTLTTLQRVYFNQYLTSAFQTATLPKSDSKYKLLLGERTDAATKKYKTVVVNDDEVAPELDNEGRIKKDVSGAFLLRLKESETYKRFYWEESTYDDREMYRWFRANLYDGKSLRSLLAPAWIPGLLIFLFLSSGLIAIDVSANKDYIKGEAIRGTRLLSFREWKQEKMDYDGIGIEAYEHTRRAR